MSQLLQAGLSVTAIGLGVVFVLLTSLVFIIKGMSALSRWLEGPATVPSGSSRAGTPASSTTDRELVGVISAAIAAHRQKLKGTARKRN